jgi:hypothetical protein
MKKILRLLMSACVLLMYQGIQAQTSQNQIWAIPGKQLKYPFLTTPNLPSDPLDPDRYDGQPAQHCYNGMQDRDGNLLFFVVDSRVFDRNGYLIGELVNNTYGSINGNQEIALVPMPGNCNKYYIFTANDAFFSRAFYGVVDLALTNPSTGAKGVLQIISGETAVHMSAVTADERMRIGFAATKLRGDNSRFIFVSRGSQIFRYKLTTSVISYDNYNFQAVTGGSNMIRSELEIAELSDGTYRLAGVATGGSNQNILYKVDLNSSGNVVPNTTITHTKSSSNYIHGIEFSPSGRYLYFTFETSTNPFRYIDLDNYNGSETTITSSADFKQGNIELGYDNKLYIAAGNRLASFANPDNPGSAWSDPAISITVSPITNGNHGSQASAATSYTLPDQIDGMNYKAHMEVSALCCAENSSYHKDTHTAQATANPWTPSSNPLNGGTGAVATIREKLIIPAGVNITITGMTLQFAPGASLVIMDDATINGGRLTLNNTTLTAFSSCSPIQLWEGVEVYGRSGLAQGSFSNSRQGWLVMNNNSVIEYAKVGVATYKRLPSQDLSKSGGVVQATDSYFKNNLTGASFKDYSQASASLFTRCEFSYSTNSAINAFDVFASITNQNNVRFFGTKFKNNNPQSNIALRGFGVVALNSKIVVNINCNIFSFNCPPANTILSEFHNLFVGIYGNSPNNTNNITCERAILDNNVMGIYMEGMYSSRIVSNTFRNYNAWSTGQPSCGLFMENCTQFKVEDNDFTTRTIGWPPFIGDNNYGAVVINSGELHHNYIYRNRFYGLYIGGQSEGINATAWNPHNPNDIGLRWKCNKFTSLIHRADLSVTSGRIAYLQGHCLPSSDPQSKKVPAGNWFSNNNNFVDNHIAVNPSAAALEYSHHVDYVTTPHYIIVNPPNNRVTPKACFSPQDPVYYGSDAEACPSMLGLIIIMGMEDNESEIMGLQSMMDNDDVKDEAAKEDLAAKISSLIAQRQDAFNAQVSIIISDTTLNDNYLDLLIDLMKEEKILSINELLSSTYLQKGDYSSAKEVLNLIRKEKGNNNFCKMQEMLIEMKSADKTETEFFKSREAAIRAIATDNEDYTGKAMAKGILAVVFNEYPTISVEPLEEPVNPKSLATEEDKTTTVTDNFVIEQFVVYPNPASEQVSIAYYLNNNVNTASIEIINSIGQVVSTTMLNGSTGTIQINTSEFAKGIYMITLFEDGIKTRQEKLVIK